MVLVVSGVGAAWASSVVANSGEGVVVHTAGDALSIAELVRLEAVWLDLQAPGIDVDALGRGLERLQPGLRLIPVARPQRAPAVAARRLAAAAA